MMDVAHLDTRQTYEALKTELQICEIGGLFLALYDDEAIPDRVIVRLERDLPEQFHFRLHIDEQKVAFPIFFRYTFEEIGRQSTTFHILGIEDLPEKSISDFLSYLQLQRDNLQAKLYTLVFWISPQLEKRLFNTAPDFHHWVFGTYDFRGAEQWQDFLTDGVEPDREEAVSLQSIDAYYEKVIWQYEHWEEVKDSGESFLIEVMERADLHAYYVQSFCTDAAGKTWLLDDFADHFLVDNERTFLTLLGDFGTGKSSFALHYFIRQARKYLRDKTARMPIFISLKNYPGRLHIEDFIVQEFYEKYGIRLSFSVFRDLALQGRFIFLTDGFDEMASLADAELTIQNLKELTKLSFENILFMTKKAGTPYQANKVLLTTRTHYFLSEAQEKEVLRADYTILYRNYATKSNYEIARINLKEFNQEQIEEYVSKNTRGEEATKNVLSIIKDTYNLEELSTRPILLEMIVKTLPTLEDKKGINAADLYRAYTSSWIERDDWRSQMTPDGKRAFMWQLALKMFKKGGGFSLHFHQLDKPAREYLKENYESSDQDYYKYETTTCAFLNRDPSGNYKFIHKSFMEYFLAEYFFNSFFIDRAERIAVEFPDFNRESLYFLNCLLLPVKEDLCGIDLSGLRLQQVDLSHALLSGSNLSAADLRAANLSGANLRAATLHGIDLHGANLRGADLSETDLKEVNIRGVDLRGVNLRRVDLCGVDLSGMDLSEADLREAKLMGTILVRATLQGVDLSEANLHKANLKGANLQGSNLRRANLLEAVLTGADLHQANLRGAILKRADIFGASLSRADLQGSQMAGTDLRRSDLSEADLSGVDLSEANLGEAKLFGANLRGTNLKGTDLARADLRETNLGEADHLSEASLTRVDLSGVDLSGADLSEAKLFGANLRGTNLKGTDLARADLRETNLMEASNLSQANLKGADLSGFDLSGFDLSGFDLSHVRLVGANLRGANLRGTDLKSTNLSRADLKETNLREAENLSTADLSDADLRGVDLQEFDLSRATLSGARLKKNDLRKTNLTEANLKEADLRGVDLRRAKLTGALLVGSDLQGADLRGADLRKAKLTGALLMRTDLTGVDLSETDLDDVELNGARQE